MKILHVVPSYIPAYRYGGPIKAVHELCKALAKNGLDVTVFTTDIDWEKNSDVPLGRMVEMDGVKVFYYPVRRLRRYCFSSGLADAVKMRVREFDIVHIHSVYLYPTMIACYWCRKFGIPYIINPFGALDPSAIRLKGRIRKSLYLNLVERRNIDGAKFIYAASGYEKDKILSMRFNAPVVIMPRGLEISDYSPGANPGWFFDRYPQLKNKKVILFLGRIHRKKGLDLLAAALKKITDKDKSVFLAVVGPREDAYAASVETLFKKEGVMENAVFTDMLLGDEKLSAFYSSDIFILPSYGENFGIAVLEAMACGIPVVVTDAVALHPDIAEYGAGIVTKPNADALASAALDILRNRDIKNEMGECGRRLVRDRFAIDNVALKMIEAYKDAVKR